MLCSGFGEPIDDEREAVALVHSVVCIKQVPDSTEVRIDPKTNSLRREGVPSIINPYDAHAVEEALRVKESLGGRVTLLSMGPPQAAEALRKALSWGADRAILMTDRAFAGSDTLATSYVLSAAIERIRRHDPVSLIWCGKQAIDGDTAQVGPGIAARLKLPLLTYVMRVEEVNPAGARVTVHRKLEGSRERLLSVLPAVITVVKDINEIRYASFPNLLAAARAEIEIWKRTDLELEDSRLGIKGSPTTVGKIFAPPARPGGRTIGLNPDNEEAEIASVVAELVLSKVVADS